MVPVIGWVILHPIAFVLVLVLTPPPRGWAGGCGHCSGPSEGPQISLGSAWVLWWDHSGQSGSLVVPTHVCSLQGVWVSPAGAQADGWWVILESSPLEPPSTCAFTPSACKGQICHQKRQPLLFFFCILINTEEAGAVKLYLEENLKTGLSGVVEPLTAFNTQLVINCFVYLFSVFISTNKHCNYSY